MDFAEGDIGLPGGASGSVGVGLRWMFLCALVYSWPLNYNQLNQYVAYGRLLATCVDCHIVKDVVTTNKKSIRM